MNELFPHNQEKYTETWRLVLFSDQGNFIGFNSNQKISLGVLFTDEITEVPKLNLVCFKWTTNVFATRITSLAIYFEHLFDFRLIQIQGDKQTIKIWMFFFPGIFHIQ